MKYTKEMDIGHFAGLGQGGMELWRTDAKALRARLVAISVLSKWDTYRALENEFRAFPVRSEKLLETGAQKTAIIAELNKIVVALPGWYGPATARKKPSKTWLAQRLINSLTRSIDIAEGRVPILFEKVEVPAAPPPIAPPPPEPIVPPTEPTDKIDFKEPEGISKTTILVGIGLLVAGAGLLMLRKKK